MKRVSAQFFFLLLFIGSEQSVFSQTFKELNDSLVYYYNNNDLKKAIVVGEKGVLQAQKEFGIAHTNYATSLDNLAAVYDATGEYTKAEPLYLNAIELWKKIVGEDHPDYATSLNTVGVLYYNMGQYTKAESLYLIAAAIWKKVSGNIHPDYATCLNNLGVLYKKMGEYAKAESVLLESINIKKKIVGSTHPDYASSVNELANIYLELSRYEMAKQLYIEVLEIRKNVLKETHPDYVTSLNNLGNLYRIIGVFDKAEPLLIQAIEIETKVLGENHPEYAITLNNLATLYESMGQYEKAEHLHIKSIEIKKKTVGEKNISYAKSLNNLALLYKKMGQYKKAEELYLKSGQIRLNLLGESHPDYAIYLNNLAALYDEIGEYEKAEPLYLQAQEIKLSQFGENHSGYAQGLNNLASLYERIGKNGKADSLYSKAIGLYKETLGETNPDYITCRNNLALLNIKEGNYAIAETLLYETNRLVLNNLSSVFNILSEEEKEHYLFNNMNLIDNNNSLLFHFPQASHSFYETNYNLQLVLKSLSLTNAQSLINIARISKDTGIQELFSQWQENKKELSRQYSLPVDERMDSLSRRITETEGLEKELTRKLIGPNYEQPTLQIKTTDVQKNLKEDEVAIEFVRFNLFSKKWTDSIIYAAYVLNKNDPTPVFVSLCEEKKLQKLFDSAGTTATAMVSKFYRGLEVKSKNTAGALGAELYKLIWQPLEPYLKNVKKVSYSPAGKLYSIAFHALPVDSTTVLMDKYQLQQYTSTRQVVLREQEKQNSKPQDIALFGDASFTLDSLQIVKGKTKTRNVSTSIYIPQNIKTRGRTWSSLPGTAQEVITINKVFEQNKITTKTFTQTTASEENLKALNNNSPQILHIATHGFFLPEIEDIKKLIGFINHENTYTLAKNPLLRSGLILSGGNYAWSGKTPIEGVEDGIATAYEISQLNLSNTELVVLSACETALGDVKGSEGVFGLQRAFKMAGVKKMIVSLWQVPDKETAELMTSFYGYWMKGKTINDAFTQAQADMRKKYSPFYWAAFVLVE